MENIYLAGGCFWGLEAYFDNVNNVNVLSVGYANGTKINPSYEDVYSQKYNFAEALHLEFHETKISLTDILDYFFQVIDPTSLNKQGNDKGLQYRTGIYYINHNQKEIIIKYLTNKQKDYDKSFKIEVLPLNNYYKAEEYHQKYLAKNPSGYCHINKSLINNPKKK